jgi:hypothetical protein
MEVLAMKVLAIAVDIAADNTLQQATIPAMLEFANLVPLKLTLGGILPG